MSSKLFQIKSLKLIQGEITWKKKGLFKFVYAYINQNNLQYPNLGELFIFMISINDDLVYAQ